MSCPSGAKWSNHVGFQDPPQTSCSKRHSSGGRFCPVLLANRIKRPSAPAVTVGVLIIPPSGSPSDIHPDHPFDQFVCSICSSAPPTARVINLPSPLRAMEAGHSPNGPPADAHPDHPLLQAVCQMCHRLPSIAKMNSSRRPSPLGANTGDPNNLGMPWSSGWNPSSTHS
jgi:hypothetical protein